MSSLSEKILGFEDPYLALRPEPTPEWEPAGVPSVWIRGWTAKERDKFDVDFGDVNKVNIRARVVVRYVFDDSGTRIFSDDDAAALGEKNSVVINRLFEAVTRLAGITKEAGDTALKNSSAGPAGNKNSNSPETSDA